MSKIMNSKSLNLVVLFSILVYLIFSMRYSIVVNDDMLDYILTANFVYHGRIISHVLQVFFINTLLCILGIHVQDFAIISEAFVKSIAIVFLVNTISSSFFLFRQKNIILPFMNIGIFFLLFAFIFKLHFIFGIDISAFFYGYIFPIPFFLLFWFKIISIYLRKIEVISKKDYLIIALLFIILLTSNEEYAFVSLFILLFLLFQNVFQKKIKILLFVLMLFLILSMIIFFYKGFIEILNGYNISFCFNFSKVELFEFLYVVFNKIFYAVFFLWIPAIIGCIILYNNKINLETNKKLVKIILISILSFLFFFSLLYFLGPTFSYENYAEYYLFPRYWILHPGLLLSFYSFLISVNLVIWGNIFSQNIRKSFYILTSIFFIGCVVFIIRYFEVIKISDISRRQNLYVMEKLSVFYLKQDKTAILPSKNADLILPTYNNNMPKDLEDKTGFAYKDKIYKGYAFLQYINYIYNVNVEPGMQFINGGIEEALQIFKTNGGIISKNELKKLNFSKIKNDYITE